MRARTFGLSLVAHAALGAVLASLAAHDRPAPPRSTTTIELVAGAPPAPPVVAAPEGGGGPGGGAPGAAAPRSATRRMARAQVRTQPRGEPADPRGEIRIERAGGATGGAGIEEGAGGDGGDGGGGAGAGRGRGLGLGDGARIASAPVAIDTPVPPPASRARPATLVYPVRQREVSDSELFVAQVTIDHDGYVVGAKLVRGFGGPRDAAAADLIWRFRYAPALDDEGRPIRSTLEQRFLVGR